LWVLAAGMLSTSRQERIHDFLHDNVNGQAHNACD
jgi:hypothetical protein